VFSLFRLWVAFMTLMLAACATRPIAPVGDFETLPDAFTVPYKISTAGHLMVDISVNGGPAQPFIIDTGANTSAIYEENIPALNLAPSDNSVAVNGLVSTDLRPKLQNIVFQIGPKTFRPDQIVALGTPTLDNEAIGLLGVDLLSSYTAIFNKDALTVTFVPSQNTSSKTFSGWRKITLRNRVRSYPDNGLYFAQVGLKGSKIPVLIDTGSDLNIVNWPLAMLDDEIRKYQKQIRENMQFQGAIETAPLRVQTIFFDVVLGNQTWPEVDVVVMDFDTFTTIAPVDEPFMIAGATMFNGSTFAFDFEGNRVYIREP